MGISVASILEFAAMNIHLQVFVWMFSFLLDT